MGDEDADLLEPLKKLRRLAREIEAGRPNDISAATVALLAAIEARRDADALVQQLKLVGCRRLIHVARSAFNGNKEEDSEEETGGEDKPQRPCRRKPGAGTDELYQETYERYFMMRIGKRTLGDLTLQELAPNAKALSGQASGIQSKAKLLGRLDRMKLGGPDQRVRDVISGPKLLKVANESGVYMGGDQEGAA